MTSHGYSILILVLHLAVDPLKFGCLIIYQDYSNLFALSIRKQFLVALSGSYLFRQFLLVKCVIFHYY